MTNRRNRGKNSKDHLLFGAKKQQAKLKEALVDMRYLLTRGYAEKSAVQLVGNRYRLNTRQQQALRGMSASTQQIENRGKSCLSLDEIGDAKIMIDGFNLLIILESAMSGAYIFKGLDGVYRDLSGVHGSYKRVQQTEKALLLVGDALKHNEVLWVFDKPVSNSGRLKTLLREIAQKYGFSWTIILENNPDGYLVSQSAVLVSSDAWVLDRAERWLNLAAYAIEHKIDHPEIINLF